MARTPSGCACSAMRKADMDKNGIMIVVIIILLAVFAVSEK